MGKEQKHGALDGNSLGKENHGPERREKGGVFNLSSPGEKVSSWGLGEKRAHSIPAALERRFMVQSLGLSVSTRPRKMSSVCQGEQK